MTQTLAHRPLHIELGCGVSKRNPQSVGVDLLDMPGVDVVGDAVEVLRGLSDGCVETIYSSHFMEHIDAPRDLLAECARVLRPGGEFRAVVPHFSNPAFYSDPTHNTFYGLYTFSYWVAKVPFTRGVPQYEAPLPFEIVSARHSFGSSRPFYVRHGLKKAASWWVGLGIWTQEFYEEHLCWIMPAYEIEFVLKRQE